MTQKITSLIFVLISAALVLVGYILSTPEFFGLCYGGGSCLPQWVLFGIGHPLYLSIYPLPLLFIALMFVKNEVFQTWWKVALPVGIVFILIVLWAPPLPDLLTPDRTWFTKQLSLLFVAISAVVVGWKYWMLSRK